MTLKSKDWALESTEKPHEGPVLERCLFSFKNESVYLVAEAYRGNKIKQATQDFLAAAEGKRATTFHKKNHIPDLVVYIGHNGLMDFSVVGPTSTSQKRDRDAVILACKSICFLCDFQPPKHS